MNIIYITLIILSTVILNVSITLLMPTLKVQYKLFISGIKHVLNRKSEVDCSLLEKRVEELEQQYKQRQINFRQRVREEVKIYLEELKNK